MWNDIKQAVHDGILLSVKLIVVILAVMLTAGWFISDYSKVREMAIHGEITYQQILKKQNAPHPSNP